jgi:hypothetical protein
LAGVAPGLATWGPSGGPIADKSKTKCLFCGEIVTVDARNRGRQKYCPKPACRAAGKAARQHRWLSKPENRYYFRDAVNAARVREWQRAHPGYWKKNTTRSKQRALQDGLRSQVVEPARSPTSALQDALHQQGPVLIGLIAHLSDSTLQDDIAQTSRRLLQLGPGDPLGWNTRCPPNGSCALIGYAGYLPSSAGSTNSWSGRGYLQRCNAQALALYLMLVTVADSQGLSYYGDASIYRLLSIEPEALERARGDLIRVGLIAWQRPLYQVLALGPPSARVLAPCSPFRPHCPAYLYSRGAADRALRNRAYDRLRDLLQSGR